MSFSVFILFLFLFPSSSSSQPLSSFSVSDSPWYPSDTRTLLSPNTAFSAGFSNVSPSLFTFSVWYTNITNNTNVVWSLNRDLTHVRSSVSLIITPEGDLRLINSSSGPNLWPSVNSNSSSTRLLLTDEGCLVFGSWKSFDHPTDTILPGQTITNATVLVSANGKFQFSGMRNLVFNKSDTYWSWSSDQGSLLGLGTDGQIRMDTGKPTRTADYDQNRTRRLALNDDGNLRMWSFDPNEKIWVVVWEAFQRICTAHGLCGPNSICYSDGSTESGYVCVCPPGFKWGPNPGSCERKIPFRDSQRSKFLSLDYVNFSGGSDFKFFHLDKCRSKCLENSKCLGFGFKYDGTGYCMLQLDKLLNGFWSPDTKSVFCLRVDSLEPSSTNFTGMVEVLNTTCPVQLSLPNPPERSREATRNIIIIAALFTLEIASGVLLFWAFLRRYVKYRDMAQTLGIGLLPTAGPKRFSYAEIKTATNDFSEANVIGKGGFSDVYSGTLHDGRPVAVKCLKDVKGGDTEFWAEVTIIARMHHLNLVRLWGFCNEKGQRILVYEHVPNGSLNTYLFKQRVNRVETESSTSDLEEKPVLDWNIRYRIALGVARAIAYLHEECLEWVLHCDIKPENILLGDDFCPKVADFGLSKLKKKEQLVTMSKIRGTRGYLAPEWTKRDPITSKVDVYSFGMVLLEIVSGVRNTMEGPSGIPSEEWYFPKWAFEMAIQEKRIDEILDREIVHSYDSNVHSKMVERMVKTAMWCLQERPETRPSMGKVAKMLEGTVEIMEPPKPTIFFLG